MDGNTKFVEFQIEELSLYRKKKIEAFYIESCNIAAEGETICVPTLEGKVEITASHEQYIMIGPCDDIYPIPRRLFEAKYAAEPGGCSKEIAQQMEKLGWKAEAVKKCRLAKESYVYAKEIPYKFAVFVKHCNSTIYGEAGDFYARSWEDMEDRYVISSQVMKITYELIGG